MIRVGLLLLIIIFEEENNSSFTFTGHLAEVFVLFFLLFIISDVKSRDCVAVRFDLKSANVFD